MILAACPKLTLRPVVGVWFRAIPDKFWTDALEVEHTRSVPGRFSRGSAYHAPFQILYLAETQDIALRENRAIFGPLDRPFADPSMRHTRVFDLSVKLRWIADLTDNVEQAKLDVSVQELTGNWDTYASNDAPTQLLGAALFETAKVEGFLAISAHLPKCRNLIVFPEKLSAKSRVTFDDKITGKTHRLPPPSP
jgi:hypothetical protein